MPVIAFADLFVNTGFRQTTTRSRPTTYQYVLYVSNYPSNMLIAYLVTGDLFDDSVHGELGDKRR